MEWQRTEVDGVPTYWSRHVDGADDAQLTVGLAFRVGQADEPLARRGITHMIEHLALYGIGQPLDHVNGEVDATSTTFYRRGSAAEVTEFVDAVCRGLRKPPVDRMAAEVQVLRTEAASRGTGVIGPLLIWRYGAASYGLSGYQEFGVGHQRPEDLRVWADYWFTRGNAVLWVLGGPPPATLRVDLPDGPRFPPPRPSSTLPRTPAYFNNRVKGVALLSVVDRGPAASLYSLVLRSRLHQLLRNDLGISYSPSASSELRDATTTHIVAFADGLAEVSEKLVAEFTGVLDRLADEPMPAAELAERIALLRRTIEATRTEWADGVTSGAALAELVGARPITIAEAETAFDALSPQDIQAIAKQARDNALLMLPGQHRPPGTRYSAAPASSPGTVDGHVLKPVDGGREKLIVGPFGVSRAEGLSFATVKYADCQLMNAWPDGTRQLFGLDGISVFVDPAQWWGGNIAPGIIDANVSPWVVLALPPRPGKPAPPPVPEPVGFPSNQRRGLFGRR